MMQSKSQRKVSRLARQATTLGALIIVTALVDNCGGTWPFSVPAAQSSQSSSSLSQSSSTSNSSSGQSSSSPSSSATGTPPVASGGWTDVTAGIPGGQVSVVAAVPGQDEIIALTGGGSSATYETVTAWSSTDGGSTWVQIGQGSGSAALTVNPIGIRFDPKSSSTFWVYGYFAGTNGGLYKTTDGGNTFTSVTPTGIAVDEVEDVSVDAGSNTVLATEHERSQAVFKSTDGGQTWAAIGAGLPAGTAFSEYTYIADASTYLVGCSFAIDSPGDTGGGTTAIYQTTDGGTTWTAATNGGYAVFSSPTVLNGVLYWSYYNGNDGGIITSSDSGASWTVLQPNGLYYKVVPVALQSGQIASVTTSNEVMLFTPGTTSATTLTGTIGFNSVDGLVYDSVRNALFAWQQGGGIERLDLQ